MIAGSSGRYPARTARDHETARHGTGYKLHCRLDGQLPTAQQVVAKLAINPNTVHKAYRELERDGLARARPGLGTFITRSPSGTDPATQARFLAAMADWLCSARSAGLGAADIEAIYCTAVRDCFAEGAA